jgi:hypothetical protein
MAGLIQYESIILGNEKTDISVDIARNLTLVDIAHSLNRLCELAEIANRKEM